METSRHIKAMMEGKSEQAKYNAEVIAKHYIAYFRFAKV